MYSNIWTTQRWWWWCSCCNLEQLNINRRHREKQFFILSSSFPSDTYTDKDMACSAPATFIYLNSHNRAVQRLLSFRFPASLPAINCGRQRKMLSHIGCARYTSHTCCSVAKLYFIRIEGLLFRMIYTTGKWMDGWMWIKLLLNDKMNHEESLLHLSCDHDSEGVDTGISSF